MTCRYILCQFSWGHDQTPNVASGMQRITCCNSFTPFKSQRESLTSEVIFAVSRYEGFMENKNIIRTFCVCKPSRKRGDI